MRRYVAVTAHKQVSSLTDDVIQFFCPVFLLVKEKKVKTKKYMVVITIFSIHFRSAYLTIITMIDR